MFDNSQEYGNRDATFISNIRDILVSQCIANGFDVIVDETFADPEHLREFQSAFGKFVDIEVVDHFLEVPLDTCLYREYHRGSPLGSALIREYAKIFRAQGIKIPKEEKYHV